MLGSFLFHCSILSKVGASEKTGAIHKSFSYSCSRSSALLSRGVRRFETEFLRRPLPLSYGSALLRTIEIGVVHGGRKLRWSKIHRLKRYVSFQ